MRTLLILSKLLSAIFRPSYYPTMAFVTLLTLTYLSLMPWVIKLWLLAMVYMFTVLLPHLGIYLYRKAYGWSERHLAMQHRRVVPYTMYIIGYGCTLALCHNSHLPSFMAGIIVASLMVQSICIVVNIRWKVSMHSAGSGAIIGALLAYSLIFTFNPTWWLCLAIMLNGLVMTSRLLLRQHTLEQVLCGSGIGIVCGFCGIILS